ncbi:MAG: PAS domain-containing protein [Candidatus Marinimicrobia bacterium]|nr:PAS domain-containing protein [Candidatus Neomarinimicrobiota bacterium]
MDTKSQSSHLPVSILRNMSDAVIATDKRGMITFTNPQADSLTGWNHDDALGQPVRTVIKLLDSEKMTTVKIPAPSFFQHNHKPLDLSHYILVSNDEKQTLIDAKLTPITGYRWTAPSQS